jgi:hypothetical protein
MGMVIRRIQEYTILLGGEAPVGWIPPGASQPQPTPKHAEVFEFEISREEDGFLLTWKAHPSPTVGDLTEGDSWYRSLEDALQAGLTNFGIPIGRWAHTSD